MKANTPTTVIGAFKRGRRIFVRICQSLQPSMRAASSNSRGKDSRNCRIRNAPNAPNAKGTMSAKYEFTRPMRCMPMYSGITRTS